MNLNEIKKLHADGYVSDAQLTRAKVWIRYKELCVKYKSKNDVYFILSEEFCLSEGRIRNMISECRK